jgi:hypothetical protein
MTSLVGERDTVLQKHFIELGRSGRIKFQVGSGTNLYDFVYAGNAAEGLILAAKVGCFFQFTVQAAIVSKRNRLKYHRPCFEQLNQRIRFQTMGVSMEKRSI